ncbi:MAG: ABC-F family ATP-binding cassette domain-containing protein [Firmicutes bacterium]|nr:ABC-F family ATP-binding cassette domain-containing protein [Bacillota bacterium]
MKIENLCMSFGTQTIFDNISFQINNNDKVGIIGVNGAGKSTLFNILLGNITPDAGNITLNSKIKLGYLPQVIMDDASNEEETVFEYLLEGRPIKELKEELNSLYEIIARTQDEYEVKKYYKKINRVSELLEYYDEYNAEGSLLKIISGMNIDDNLLDLKLKNISGGQKSKVAFARLLYSNPEIMLLDEPTNHLDLDTKDYIINYLKNYHGIILVISHDIEFLNEVTQKTLYVDKIKHNVEMYNVNYEKYIKIKNERDLAKKRLYERQQKEEEKLKSIIAKYIRGNEKKANIAKDRIKKLEKLESEKVELEKKNKYTKFNMKINRPSYSIPIKCNNLTFGYDEENLLYENLNFDLSRGEKLLVVGENGIGKTTLLRLIMGYLKPLEGNIEITEKTDIAYYAQEHEILEPNKTILENFANFGLADYEIRRMLGSFLFSGDDIFKKVEVLSPGERSRVALAKISLTGANTLLLDEPTNHLDPMTQLIISDTFKNYKGTMLVVSHNLDFVDNLNINRMLLLPSGRITYYDRDIVMHYEMLEEENK